MRECVHLVGLALLITAIGTATSLAEPPSPRLASTVTFRPTTDHDVAQARREIELRVADVEQFLGKYSDGGDAWQKYLKLAVLRSHLQVPQSADISPPLDDLYSVLHRFQAHHDGLDRKPIVALRNALENYVLCLEDQAVADPQEQLHSQLTDLSQALESFERHASLEAFERIEQCYHWLHRRRQATESQAQLRQRFSQPNVVLSLSPTIAAATSIPIEQTWELPSLGETSVLGTAVIQGRATFSFVDHQGKAALQIDARGTAESGDSVLDHESTRIFAPFELGWWSRKRILLDSHGLLPLPARTNVLVESSPQHVATSYDWIPILNLIAQDVAWDQVCSRKSEAESAVAEQAQRECNSTIDSTVDLEVEGLNAKFRSIACGPLERMRQFPELTLRVTDGTLNLQAIQADAGQLGAPGTAPNPSRPSDMHLVVHQTAMNNLAARFLAGRSFRYADVGQQLSQLLGIKPPEKADEDLRITFADEQPLTVRFDQYLVTVTLRGKEFFANGRWHATPLEMTTVYAFRPRPQGGYLLEASEPPRVEPPRGQAGIGGIALRRILKNALSRKLPEQVTLVSAPAPGFLGDLKTLSVVECHADRGWLLLSLRHENVFAKNLEPALVR